MPIPFTEEQQKQIRENLFRAGIRLSKELGLQRMTVSKLAKEAGIAKGSFYHFFESKEEFILALADYDNEKMKEMLANALAGRKQMTTHEFFLFLREYFYSDYDFMGRLTIDDFIWINTHMDVGDAFDARNQLNLIKSLLPLISDAREDVDYGTVVNLVKSIYAMREHRTTMVLDSLDNSIELVLRLLEVYISGKGRIVEGGQEK